jgi:crotonobetainyl-CoA:carnitine CoA-transferase CaiB-like acyl-CoA transferase
MTELREEEIVGFNTNPEYAKFIYSLVNPDEAWKKPEALDDILVLDLSYGNFAGLYASSILAELGAEVIRIEPPEGDIARKMTPFGIMIKDAGLAYINEARNKLHITLDLKSEKGREAFKRLVRKADVLIETFKPGYMDSIGLGYRQLKEINPGLIYCAITSYGQFGEDAEKHKNQPNYDLINQTGSLIMSLTGEAEFDPEVPAEYKKPLKHGSWTGWYIGGQIAALGILIALFYRRKTGKGQFIDVSPREMFATADYHLQLYHLMKRKLPRRGNFDHGAFPYTYVRSKDGYVFLAAAIDPHWDALCEMLNREDLRQKFPTHKDRLILEKQPEILREIEKSTSNYTFEELLKMTMEISKKRPAGTVVVGKLLSPKEVLNSKHLKVKRMFIKLEDPHYGEILIVNSVFRWMSRTPGRVKWACRPIGADNDYVFRKYIGPID